MSKKLKTLLVTGLLGLSSASFAMLPPIKPGVPGKQAGDIIAPMLDEQIAAWCDFNKQIVVTRTNILCAYVGDKASFASHSLKTPPKKMAQNKPIPKDLTPTPYEMNEYGDV
jgi:hypothetical protein